MSAYVKKVHFKLHDSYSNPNRVVTKPPYEVVETGWGEFEIVIKIYFQGRLSKAEKKLKINYLLRLIFSCGVIVHDLLGKLVNTNFT